MLMTCRYITFVSPVTDFLKVDTLRPTIQAAGSDLAASLLAERFALPNCTGIQQLCTEIAHFRKAEGSHQALSFNRAAAETIPHDLASSLVAIVDRADAAASSSSSDSLQHSLSPAAFITHVTGQFILAVITSNRHATHSQAASSGQHAEPDCFDGQDTQHQLAFMAEVIGRLCRRGHVAAVAKALWSHMLAVHEYNGKQQHEQQHAQQSQAKLADEAQNQSMQPSQQQSQQQPHQQQELQQLPESQQLLQQQQQQQQPQQNQGCQSTPLDAPVAATSETLAAAQQAVCCIVAAMQDSAALDKLLTALHQQTDAIGDANDSSLEMMQCIVRPLWARGTVRQALSTVHYVISTIYCLPSIVYCLQNYCLLCTVHGLLSTVYHLLLTVCHPLSTVYCLLSTVYCLLSTVYCLLSTVYCLLSTVYHPLFTVYCLLSTVYCLPSTVYCLPSMVFCLLSTVYFTIVVLCSLPTVY